MRLAKGLVIAAPRSGSGKTAVTLGLARMLTRRGMRVAPAKAGPDYIDPAFLARAAGTPAVNLDIWAMGADRVRDLAARHGEGHDLVLIEGVMGLFDGAVGGGGSTADLAAALDLPVVLVVDCQSHAQSVAALVHGFASWRADVEVAGVILNRVASDKHEAMLRGALKKTGIPCLGAVPRRGDLELPARHLGLVLPGDVEGVDDFIARAGAVMDTHIDGNLLAAIARAVGTAAVRPDLAPLGQHIAVAHDAAFAFVYPHMLDGWHGAGARLSFFSPLADEAPAGDADAVFLPGGYPELHGARLAEAHGFRAGLEAARDRGTLIYGECGGFMVLGETLTDKAGITHPMTGLLPVAARIDRPRRVLGYRVLTHASPLPWPARLMGHEFHYSSAAPAKLPPLYEVADAAGEALGAMGARDGRVMGSYAHVIAGAEG
ncbi:cobyrinate a,c-diamide synthase [Pelagibacterium xiamenense]|uniref:cobyrinate a,c-diamide synthase n=1 Tax=Pelagibacterium xiamenense TaxID=2901140 RepID=UPI001E599069|nr:cobyrinate a,c-diamide synthase [Pelagibacterium xiamenense]MCD7058831.1 cobyrinate a,c-diamide synthase [Pelagibacterium xiamenense]